MPGRQDKQRGAGYSPGSKAALLFFALVATTRLAGAAAAASPGAATTLRVGLAARALATSSENPCPIQLTTCEVDDECEECVASVAAAMEECAEDPSTSASSVALDTCDDSAAICCGLQADGGTCVANTWFKSYIECVAAAGDCATDIDDCVAPTPSPTSVASGDFIGHSRVVASHLFSFAAAVGLIATSFF
eukprot:g8633.t1